MDWATGQRTTGHKRDTGRNWMPPVQYTVGKVPVLARYLFTFSSALFQKGLLIQTFCAPKPCIPWVIGISFLNLPLLVSQQLQDPFTIENLGKEAEVEDIHRRLSRRERRRQTISLALKKWEERGTVKRSYAQVLLVPSLEWSHREKGTEVPP